MMIVPAAKMGGTGAFLQDAVTCVDSGADSVRLEHLSTAIDEHATWFVPWLRDFSSDMLRRERVGHTLQATALANEVIAKLLSSKSCVASLDERLLRVLAAAAVRNVLVDHARRRGRLKRGGHCVAQSIDLDEIPDPMVNDRRILAIHEALSVLESTHPDEAELVKHRYFGGLSVQEAGRLLGWSPRTAARRWSFAKGWLRLQLEGREEL